MRKIFILLLIFWGGSAYGANVASVDGVSDASISTINAVAGNVIGTIDGATYNDGDGGTATITFIALTSKNDLLGSAGAQTFTGPSVSGSNTVLLIGVEQNYGTEPADPTVLYNGVSLGSATWETNFVNYNKSWVWLVKNPGSAQTVSIDIDTGVGVAIAMSYNNVDQATTYRTASIATGAASPATVNVENSQTNDLIIGFFSLDDATTGYVEANIGAGQTYRTNLTGHTSEAFGASCDEPGASGTVTHSWSYTGDYGWGVIAIPLIPAAL